MHLEHLEHLDLLSDLSDLSDLFLLSVLENLEVLKSLQPNLILSLSKIKPVQMFLVHHPYLVVHHIFLLHQ